MGRGERQSAEEKRACSWRVAVGIENGVSGRGAHGRRGGVTLASVAGSLVVTRHHAAGMCGGRKYRRTKAETPHPLPPAPATPVMAPLRVTILAAAAAAASASPRWVRAPKTSPSPLYSPPHTTPHARSITSTRPGRTPAGLHPQAQLGLQVEPDQLHAGRWAPGGEGVHAEPHQRHVAHARVSGGLRIWMGWRGDGG